jgi:hypothetical protein
VLDMNEEVILAGGKTTTLGELLLAMSPCVVIAPCEANPAPYSPALLNRLLPPIGADGCLPDSWMPTEP